jgi:hypothetical protein
VWVFDLAVFGHKFLWLQLVGFFALVLGTAVYKKMVPIPAACRDAETDIARSALLDDAVDCRSSTFASSHVHHGEDGHRA